MMDYIPCPVCEGHGYTNWKKVDGIARTCEYCSGRGYMPAPKTRAEKIRSMTDEELAREIFSLCPFFDDALHFCEGNKACEEDMENGREIPEERCIGCLVRWLRMPWKEEA